MNQPTAFRKFRSSLKHLLAQCYLSGSSGITHWLLRGRTGARDFSRVVIVAPLSRNNGIASGARLQFAAMQQLGIQAELLDGAPMLRNPVARLPHCPGTAYVIHAAGPQSASLLAGVLPHAASAYRVAYWAWELPEPPADWEGCDRHFAEIWTPSAFSQGVLRGLCAAPVHVAPHYVPAKPQRRRDPGALFTVLSMADSRSSLSRKNPAGALSAFVTAFGNSSSARLLLKLHGHPHELAAFETRYATLLRQQNITIIRGYMDEDSLAQLYTSADVFLSLHRAEGFGLPMLEAMAYGVPVIATAWPANREFMGDTDSVLIPYTLVPVADDSRVYFQNLWAEPDIEAAAGALVRLADDEALRQQLAENAHRRVRDAVPHLP